jgi:hypothetical protein
LQRRFDLSLSHLHGDAQLRPSAQPPFTQPPSAQPSEPAEEAATAGSEKLDTAKAMRAQLERARIINLKGANMDNFATDTVRPDKVAADADSDVAIVRLQIQRARIENVRKEAELRRLRTELARWQIIEVGRGLSSESSAAALMLVAGTEGAVHCEGADGKTARRSGMKEPGSLGVTVHRSIDPDDPDGLDRDPGDSETPRIQVTTWQSR